MNAPKYDPPYNEPRLDVGVDPRMPEKPWSVCVIDRTPEEQSFDPEYRTQAEADAACQRIAIAIADRVHGAELARVCARLDQAIGHAHDLRNAIIATVRHPDWCGGDPYDANIPDALIEPFDAASRFLGLPISNDDGVPAEVLPLVQMLRPTMEYSQSLLPQTPKIVVRWGPGDDEQRFFDPIDIDSAAEMFRERDRAYVAAQGGDT